MSDTWSPSPARPEPRPASTLVILRDAAGGPEVLVTVRPKNLRFMGGATVFPGGAVAPADLDPRWEQLANLSRSDAQRLSGLDDPAAALGAFVCALRESFEEVGFVIGDGTERIERATAESAARFLERCLEVGAVLDAASLVAAGRWVTPLGAPVRFDARFFLVRAPEGWEPDPDPNEVADAQWRTPADVLDDLAAGRALLAPPTIEMLQRIVDHPTVDAIIDAMGGNELTGAGDVISVRLSPFVHVVLAPNPSPMTGPGTNTYVVGAGPTCVIDPAVDDDAYIDEVLRVAGEVEAILVTHRHSDHTGGIARLVQATGAPVYAHGTEPAGGAAVVPIADGDVLEVGGARLRGLYCPGHASDHLCFVLEGTASLFAGDNVLGEGTAVIMPPDGDMKTYLSTLRRLGELHIDRIYPGHFRPLDGGRRVIEGYLAHRADRERQVREALEPGGKSVAEIVAVVYTDTPPHLHPVAEYQVLAHLEMLEEQNLVHRTGERWELDRR